MVAHHPRDDRDLEPTALEDAELFIAEATRILAESLDYNETIERAAQLPIPRFADWCFVDLLREDGSHFERVAVGHVRSDETGSLAQALRRRYSLPAADAEGAARVLVERRTRVMHDIGEAELLAIAQDEEHLRVAREMKVRSAIIAPMFVRDKGIGALSLVRCDRNYSPRDAWVGEQLARSAAAAIENARLFDAERRAHARVTRLQEVTAAFSRASTAEDVAEVACRIGTEATGGHSGALWLQQPDASLRLAGSWGIPASFIEQFRHIPADASDAPALAVMRDNAAIWVETAQDYQRVSPSYFEKALAAGRLSAFGALPIAGEGRATGVIVFAHASERVYDAADRAFYASLAQHCSQALERARLLDAERRSNFRLQLLARAGETFASSLVIEDTLRAVAKLVVPSFADWCIVDLVEGNAIRRVVVEHQDAAKVEHACAIAARHPIALGDGGAIASLIADGLARFYRRVPLDALLAAARDEEERAAFVNEGIISAILVPLKAGRDCIGVLSLTTSDSGREYNEQDLALAEELGRRAGTAIANARMHRELERAHARMRYLFSEAPMSIAIYRGAEYRLEFANPTFLRVAARSESVLGQTHAEIFPEAQGALRPLFDEVFASGQPRIFPELRGFIERGSGVQEVFFHLSLVPLRDELGRVEWLMSISLEVTERVRAREALEAARQALTHAEQRLRLALDAAKVGIWDLDPRSGALLWDARCREMYGLPLTAQVDRDSVFALTHPQDRAAVLVDWQRALAAGQACELSLDYRIHRASDGAVRWLSARGKVLVEGGQVARIVGTLADDTELRAAQAARDELLERERVARADAELANRVKDQFLATVSHELRTPLNAILGWTSILAEKQGDAALFQKGVEVIYRNARAQAKIIEDILDVSRIITGKLKLDLREVDLRSVIQDAIDVIRPSADKKKVTLELVTPHEPAPILCDPDRMQQVVWNLLSNAVKFTDAGGSISVRVEGDATTASIKVEDSGCGLAAEYLPRIFERFRQVDSSAARRFGGLGLGLAIVRHLVELHGGRVSAQSDGLGHGSLFTVELPRQEAPAVTSEEPPRPSSKFPVAAARRSMTGLRVLIVEDEPDARAMLETLLSEDGALIESTASADEALRALDEERFDVLVSDIGLPGRDGYALIRAVRERPDAARSIPAIALTAYVRDVDRDLALSSGFDAHLPKPLDLVRLTSTISTLLAAKGPRE